VADEEALGKTASGFDNLPRPDWWSLKPGFYRKKESIELYTLIGKIIFSSLVC